MIGSSDTDANALAYFSPIIVYHDQTRLKHTLHKQLTSSPRNTHTSQHCLCVPLINTVTGTTFIYSLMLYNVVFQTRQSSSSPTSLCFVDSMISSRQMAVKSIQVGLKNRIGSCFRTINRLD